MDDQFYRSTLPGEAIVHLHGSGIVDFLQGQLTCDLRPLDPQRAVAGAMCNVKGRVISDLWVIAVDDRHCCLRLRRSVASAFAENLERYARFSRIAVNVDDRREAVTGYYGRELPVEALGLDATGHCRQDGPMLLLRSGDRLVQRLDLAEDPAPGDPAGARTEGAMTVPAGTPADVLETARAGNEGDWRALELFSGHMAIEEADREQFTPQALNYDRSGRVAFDKGCYTGQEVVARLHYKGRAKQRLQVFQGSVSGASSAPVTGAAILDDEGKAVGEVLRVEDLGTRDIAVAGLLRHDETRTRLRLTDGRELSRITTLPAED